MLVAALSLEAIVSSPGFIGAVAGLITGTLASLVAPWSQWGVEKRRLRREERRELLQRARQLVTTFADPQSSFRDTPEYSRLRPYLSPKLRKDIEGDAIIVTIGDGRGGVVIWLLDEFARIERKWGIA